MEIKAKDPYHSIIYMISKGKIVKNMKEKVLQGLRDLLEE